jgi:cell shape-determining protein MreC
MSFFPDLAPIVQKLDQFSQTQSQNQAQMIALLKQISLELSQIRQELKQLKNK